MIPGTSLFQLTQGEKAEVIANCDHLQNLTECQHNIAKDIRANDRPFGQVSDGQFVQSGNSNNGI
ncbi:hypothetical protein [Limnohabitans sp.]|uniref:hypothetical protein n=1 Tax=Limnohabitans sp. TaxID=1907725 RepID=UPI0037C166B7